eukprot:scaffold173893_cov24-Tisochrysis_lutea.AAC.1
MGAARARTAAVERHSRPETAEITTAAARTRAAAASATRSSATAAAKATATRASVARGCRLLLARRLARATTPWRGKKRGRGRRRKLASSAGGTRARARPLCRSRKREADRPLARARQVERGTSPGLLRRLSDDGGGRGSLEIWRVRLHKAAHARDGDSGEREARHLLHGTALENEWRLGLVGILEPDLELMGGSVAQELGRASNELWMRPGSA